MSACVQKTAQTDVKPALPIKLPTRVITYAWGDTYIDELLSITIPEIWALVDCWASAHGTSAMVRPKQNISTD